MKFINIDNDDYILYRLPDGSYQLEKVSPDFKANVNFLLKQCWLLAADAALNIIVANREE